MFIVRIFKKIEIYFMKKYHDEIQRKIDVKKFEVYTKSLGKSGKSSTELILAEIDLEMLKWKLADIKEIKVYKNYLSSEILLKTRDDILRIEKLIDNYRDYIDQCRKTIDEWKLKIPNDSTEDLIQYRDILIDSYKDDIIETFNVIVRYRNQIKLLSETTKLLIKESE